MAALFAAEIGADVTAAADVKGESWWAAGRNHFKIKTKGLKPGGYTLVLIASNSNRNLRPGQTAATPGGLSS